MYSIIGPPGCGKSTQVELLHDHGFISVSAGELLRSKAPQAILESVTQGELADHEYTNQLMGQTLTEMLAQKPSDKIIIDGFPRHMKQVDWFMSSYKQDFSGCIIMFADNEYLVKRLLQRGRVDDTESSITRRLDIFNHNIKIIKHYYDFHQIPIHRVDGMRSIEAIHEDIKQILGID